VSSSRIKRSARPADSSPWSAEAFDAAYAAHQERARERLRRRRERAAESISTRARLDSLPLELRPRIEEEMDQARQRRASNRERLTSGFQWPGGYVNHTPVGPFVEEGLRSKLHLLLRLFVASTGRAETFLRGGNSKASLGATGGKLSLLDHAYVSFNPAMRRIIRIDLDKTFPSWDALRDAIQSAGLPPPNLAVAHVEDDGRVTHPHVYWLLANAVCGTERGRPGPLQLLRALERGIVAALSPVGADPAGMSN
jgi:hypothetical protein